MDSIEITGLLNAGFITPNEARRLFELPPLEDTDVNFEPQQGYDPPIAYPETR